jgi:hypothetical protein
MRRRARIWLWDANASYPVPNIALQPLCPGDAHVDWIGLTGYYNIGAGGRSTFDTLFEPTMEQVREFSQKPFLIAETAVSPSSEKPAETKNLFTGMENHADVLGFVWLNYERGRVHFGWRKCNPNRSAHAWNCGLGDVKLPDPGL